MSKYSIVGSKGYKTTNVTDSSLTKKKNQGFNAIGAENDRINAYPIFLLTNFLIYFSIQIFLLKASISVHIIKAKFF